MGVGGQRHGPGRLTLWKENRYIFYRRLGSIWTDAENLALIEIRTRNVQPVVIRYTDCAVNTPDEIFTVDHVDVNTNDQ